MSHNSLYTDITDGTLLNAFLESRLNIVRAMSLRYERNGERFGHHHGHAGCIACDVLQLERIHQRRDQSLYMRKTNADTVHLEGPAYHSHGSCRADVDECVPVAQERGDVLCLSTGLYIPQVEDIIASLVVA